MTAIGKILVVDDEAELKNILVEALTLQGYETLGFTSGVDALEVLRQEPFDILLTDLMMPAMEGITLVKEALKIDPNIVSIMMTGHGTIQTAVDAMQSGTFDYVLKPFRIQTMLPVITRAMNTRHLRLENVQLREAVAIHELSETIAFTLDPKTVLSKLADAALQQSQADEVSVLLPVRDTQEFYVAAVRGEKRERLLGERVPFGKSISSWVARKHEPVIVNGEVNDDRFVALWPRPDIRSSVSIPMLVARKLVGVLNLNVLDRPRPFTLGQMKALTILAGTAAAALESASLYTQVQQAEENYRSIFENSVEGIFQATRDGRFLTANPAMARILGYESPAELIETITDAALQIYVDPAARAEAARLQTEFGVLQGFEFEALRKNGEKIWVSLNRRSVRDAKGVELYREGTIEEITDRRLAEAAMRESEERYRMLFDSSPQPMWVYDVDTFAFLAVNQAAIQHYGYSKEEFLAMSIKDIRPPDDTLALLENIATLGEGFDNAGIWQHRTKDGRTIQVEITSHVVTFAGRNAELVLANDVTERRRNEEMRKRRAEQLALRGDINAALADSNVALRVILDRCTQAIVDHLGASFARIWTLNKDEDVLELQASSGLYTHLDGAHARVPVGMYKIGLIAQERAPHVTNDVQTDPRVSDKQWATQNGMVAFAGYPLIVEDRLVGVMAMFACQNLAEDTLEALGSVADIISQGIERKRAEAERTALAVEIERQRERLDSIISSVPGVVWEAWGEPDTTTQDTDFISGYVEPMLGYSVDEWLATPNFWLSIVHPDDCASASLTAADAFANGTGACMEFRWLRKDGSSIWVESNFVVIKDEAGRPLGLRGVNTDISERKSTEDALKESESNLAEAQRLAHIGSWNWDLENKVLVWSDEHFRIFGLEPGEIDVNHDETVFDFIHPEDRELVRSTVAKTLETNAAFDFYYRIVTRAGDQRIIQSTGSVETNDGGRPIRMFGTAQDVTERRRIEQELRQSEERYRDLVENAHDIIYSHDLNGNYTSMNEAGRVITGYTYEEALKLNLSQTVAPEYLTTARSMLSQKMVGEKVTAYEMEIVAKDGSHIAVEVNTKLVTQNGIAVGVQGIARDITERKRLELALRESEQQLRQSQKLEAIGQLAGGVAHDFNNLLTAINGYSALALRRIGPEHPISSYLEEIKKAGDRAANLTRQLLAFGRKQLLQPLALNVNDIVGDMMKLLKRLIGEDIQLITRPAANLKQIKADPGQLEQVLVNLVVNARDAMPRGGMLTIETANTTLDGVYASTHLGITVGEYVMLAISDTGIGMDQETQSRIFEPFFTTKEKDKGTGLGLSTVYGIVRQSGGNIWVYSEVGKGTTFKVYLPLIEEDATRQSDAITHLIKRGSETVMLVEDEDMVRKLASELLLDAGYTVLQANGGEEAIQLCRQHTEPIELLITDVVMPKMSGKQVAEQLQELHPETKVLFMSGYTDEAIVHHGVVDSNIAFIQKPFSERALAQKIRDVLDSENGHH